MDDHELLRRYAEEASDDAFRGLVERHAGLVYGVALRQLGRTHQAEEVTHAVFEALARKATGLRSGTVLAGWLFKATRFAASKLQRDEDRRQRREREAAMMMNAQSDSEPEAAWEQIVPQLDAELERLGDKDRNAIVLRFLKERSFKEVAEAMGTSEDAAKMRVGRALDRLRHRFFKRGIAVSVAVLAGAFGSPAMAATMLPPAKLMAAIAESCSALPTPSALVVAILRRLAWWELKVIAICFLVLDSVGLVVFLTTYEPAAPASPAANAPAWPVP